MSSPDLQPAEDDHLLQNIKLRYPRVLTLVLVWAFIAASMSLRNFLASPREMKINFIY